MCMKIIKGVMRMIFKPQGVEPGMVEDKRFAIFGLADKTVFTQEEYKAILKKYEGFDDFWKKWKEYIELLKKDITAMTSRIDDLQARMTTVQERGSELQAKIDKFKDAYQEIASDSTKKAEALKELFIEKKEQFLAEKDALINEYNSIQTQISNLQAQIEEITANKASLFDELNTQVQEWGGSLPTEV